MPVVFEEENTQIQNIADSAQHGQNGASASRPSESPATKFAMITFAIICLIGAYYLPSVINPPVKTQVTYLEDITEARMRLIPPDEQDSYLSSLHSRSAEPRAGGEPNAMQ